MQLQRSLLLELGKQRSKARQAQATRQQATSAQRARVLARSEHGCVTIDVGDANHEICAFDQRFQRVRATPGGVAAVKLERMPSTSSSSRITLLASLYASNESDVHDNLCDGGIVVDGFGPPASGRLRFSSAKVGERWQKAHPDVCLRGSEPLSQKLGQLEHQVSGCAVVDETRGEHDLVAARGRNGFDPARTSKLPASPRLVRACQLQVDRREAAPGLRVQWRSRGNDEVRGLTTAPTLRDGLSLPRRRGP